MDMGFSQADTLIEFEPDLIGYNPSDCVRNLGASCPKVNCKFADRSSILASFPVRIAACGAALTVTSAMTLPTRLKTDLILDAVFEVRFTSKVETAELLPGVVFPQLEDAGPVRRLPLADFPAVARRADPNLRGPLFKVTWGKHYVAVGDGLVTIGCERPYPGWASFKPAIEQVCQLVAGFADKVERYSIKYVDMLPTRNAAESVEKLDVSLSIGGIALSDQLYQLRLEVPAGELLNIVQVIGDATAVRETGEQFKGAVLDIDTLCNVRDDLPYGDFLANLSQRSEEIHAANKTLFFSCLRKDTIEELGPEYE
jgi:uncharacterized protein (TIGR04255 family)